MEALFSTSDPSNQPPMDSKIETREPHQNDESLLLLKRDELELQTKWSYAKKKSSQNAWKKNSVLTPRLPRLLLGGT
jgi:hypothetical protein